MTTSNEHPDMSGNPADETVRCSWCGKEVLRAKSFGVPGLPKPADRELLFCSYECADDYLIDRYCGANEL